MACLATVLELDVDSLPVPSAGEDPLAGFTLSRWLGGLGLGMVSLAAPREFSWPGPWLARVRAQDGHGERWVVMFGVPSGVVWDPAGGLSGSIDASSVQEGVVIAATDIALWRPPATAAPARPGTVVAINLAHRAGAPALAVQRARALPGRGLQGDRHVEGLGSFPSGPPGSALTLIESEVCNSFDRPLAPSEHRRNITTAGISLNSLVGLEFRIGAVRCRGMRLCEPCTVVQRYAGRPVLRALVHRGGLRADILTEGEIALGDLIEALGGAG
jgi:MOSC domain-containing protein YiiM